MTALSAPRVRVLALVLMSACNHRYLPSTSDGSSTGGAGGLHDMSFVVPSGLANQVNHQCPKGGHTTVSGKVWAPNGTLPLYNAIVYVPSVTPLPFPSGVSCDRCDGKVTGDPVATGLTGPDGSFVLTDVPTGKNIPIVVQLGRWRRQAVIPSVADCADTPLTDVNLTRLPRNSIEGDLPKMAIATGGADPFECLLLKIGIDAKEIQPPNGPTPGRIDFYLGTDAPGTNTDPPAPRADSLYASLSKLLTYDVLLLPCEGAPFDKSVVDGQQLSPDPRVLLQQYVDAGGRIFSTHYSYDWLTYANSPYNKLATPSLPDGTWPVGQPDDYTNTIAAALNIGFPKGADFARWLIYAGVTSPPQKLDIDQGRHDITGVNPAYAQPWATYNFSYVNSGPGVMHFTFNTPLDPPVDDMGAPQYCGRVVFSDFHVTAGALANAASPFPAACLIAPMTDQEKALAFMLFDLSSCVQQDTTPPIL